MRSGLVLGALALAGMASAFITPLPAGGAVTTGARTSAVEPLSMAKHAQFKIIKKKMHKRPKKSNPSDRNRRPREHAVDQRDMGGQGWVFPEQEGWEPYNPAVHGELEPEVLERTKGLDIIWVRRVDDNGNPIINN